MKNKLSVIARVLNGNFNRVLVCESCGNEFTCGATFSGCWCSQIELAGESRTALKTAYHDCVCRECLERMSASATVAAASAVDNPR